MLLPHFYVFRDLFLNRRKLTWNLFVLRNKETSGKRVTLQFRRVDYLTGVTHLSYKVLMGPTKDGKAIHCCDPALSVLVTFGVSKRLLHLPYFLSR